MLERVTREVEGHVIVTSGTLVCPHPDLCDKGSGETYERYVRRHAEDHNLGEFAALADAERNLGLWCFFFFHKYLWVNPELHAYPHWEIHAMVAEWEWNEDDLQHRVSLPKRKVKGYLPPAAMRRKGEYRRFKQIEVPRQCQKTSIGARCYSVFRPLREYFVNGRVNYRIIVRSATGKNTRDTLEVIRRMSRATRGGDGTKIQDLYGIWIMRCKACGAQQHTPKRLLFCDAKVERRVDGVSVEQVCGDRRISHRRISLLDETHGAGSVGRDQLSYRWLTSASDAVAAYSVWVAGLKTETTGQRPDLYTWDDPQTEDNSNTHEKREQIHRRFDGSVRELQFQGELLVFDTRKYVHDFSGKIAEEPLASLFFSLRREVRWRTDEPDNAPWVVNGWRYYYPVKGDGQPALDESAVKKLMAQMIGRTYSAEYMNDPTNEGGAKFKREDFIILSKDDPRVPPEVRYGLGCDVSEAEKMDLERLRVRVVAMNACDPSGHAKETKSGDDSFIVAARRDRHGRPFVTRLRAGRWGSKRLFNEIADASAYNRAQFTSYEMPASEIHIEEAFEKWVRDESERRSTPDHPVIVRPPMRFESMPKTTKDSRIDQVEQYLPIYILDDADDDDGKTTEKFISQFVARGSEDHDDGPDSFSRLVPHWGVKKYVEPKEEEAPKSPIEYDNGVATVPFDVIKRGGFQKKNGTLWGEQGMPVVKSA